MKIRIDFVTNSSSSSFLIEKMTLNEKQLNAIRMHSKLGQALGLRHAKDEWNVQESEHYISGYTYIDNFYIAELFKIVGIKNVVWDSFENAEEAEDTLQHKTGYKNKPLANNGSASENWEDLLDEIED